jgi:hypothetical protein
MNKITVNKKAERHCELRSRKQSIKTFDFMNFITFDFMNFITFDFMNFITFDCVDCFATLAMTKDFQLYNFMNDERLSTL